MATREITLPGAGWRPRPYQMPLWRYLESGGKRAVYVWHRRSGKDDVALHWTAIAAHQRKGTYWYMLPEQAQGRKAIWEAVNPKTGVRRIDEAFPPEIRARSNTDTMFIELRCGSTWQVIGSDSYNSLVGSPPVGLVASEWALAKPQAWAYLRPIVRENGGWALFNSTPRGKNHLYRLLNSARGDDEWFAQVLPASGTDVFSADDLAREQEELTREYGRAVGRQIYDQEYGCSFDEPVVGAIYAEQLRDAREEGRIGRVPYDPALPVHTWWDLGGSGAGGDATAVWFVQKHRTEVRLIDYYESNAQPLSHYAKVLQERRYRYGTHWLPHDARAKALGTGRSVEELAGGYRGDDGAVAGLFSGAVSISPAANVEDRINAARMLFERCYFDEGKCADGLDALASYRRDVRDGETSARPVHDWASHCADAFGEIALTEGAVRAAAKKPKSILDRLPAASGWS